MMIAINLFSLLPEYERYELNRSMIDLNSSSSSLSSSVSGFIQLHEGQLKDFVEKNIDHSAILSRFVRKYCLELLVSSSFFTEDGHSSHRDRQLFSSSLHNESELVKQLVQRGFWNEVLLLKTVQKKFFCLSSSSSETSSCVVSYDSVEEIMVLFLYYLDHYPLQIGQQLNFFAETENISSVSPPSLAFSSAAVLTCFPAISSSFVASVSPAASTCTSTENDHGKSLEMEKKIEQIQEFGFSWILHKITSFASLSASLYATAAAVSPPDDLEKGEETLTRNHSEIIRRLTISVIRYLLASSPASSASFPSSSSPSSLSLNSSSSLALSSHRERQLVMLIDLLSSAVDHHSLSAVSTSPLTITDPIGLLLDYEQVLLAKKVFKERVYLALAQNPSPGPNRKKLHLSVLSMKRLFCELEARKDYEGMKEIEEILQFIRNEECAKERERRHQAMILS
jgi:hypothetical protein